MRLGWTGKGWLALPIVFGTLLIGALLAILADALHLIGSGTVLVSMALAFALAAFPSYLLGRALNSTAGTDGGRSWHNRHRMGTAAPFGKPGSLQPLQLMWVGDAAIAYALLALFVGGVLLNSPPVGWALLLVPVVAGVVAVITVRRRRKAQPVDLDQVRTRSRQATQAIKAGQTIQFGGVRVSGTGIEWDGHFLPFADIVRIHHDRDKLYCQLHAGAYAYPLSKIDDRNVAVGVAIGVHRAATARR